MGRMWLHSGVQHRCHYAFVSADCAGGCTAVWLKSPQPPKPMPAIIKQWRQHEAQLERDSTSRHRTSVSRATHLPLVDPCMQPATK